MIISKELRKSAIKRFKEHAKHQCHQSTAAILISLLIRGRSLENITKSFNGCPHATARHLFALKQKLSQQKAFIKFKALTTNKKGYQVSVVAKDEDVDTALEIMFGRDSEVLPIIKALEITLESRLDELTS